MVAPRAAGSRFCGAMAIHAASHADIRFESDAIACGDGAVTVFTLGAGGHVGFVVEVDEAG